MMSYQINRGYYHTHPLHFTNTLICYSTINHTHTAPNMTIQASINSHLEMLFATPGVDHVTLVMPFMDHTQLIAIPDCTVVLEHEHNMSTIVTKRWLSIVFHDFDCNIHYGMQSRGSRSWKPHALALVNINTINSDLFWKYIAPSDGRH